MSIAVNYLRIQIVQILQKLRITEKSINTNFIRYLPQLLLVTVLIPEGQDSSGNGKQKCWIPLRNTAVDYFLYSQITKDIFTIVQNKMHYAAHVNIAAEVMVAVTMYLYYAASQVAYSYDNGRLCFQSGCFSAI